MKKLAYIFILITVLGCDSEKGLNCFQAAGDIIQEEVTVSEFDKIIVWERAQLIIQQGETQKVIIETGENLLNDVEVSVDEGTLNIYNNNGCNLVRDYGITKVYVTSPNITVIRNSSGLTVESIGTLSYENLTLLSEDQENEDGYHIDGNFRLQLAVDRLDVISNGLSNFYLSGTALNASIGLYAGDSRVEAAELSIDNLYVFHRSTNQMIVNPQNQLSGKIVSIGDVISVNEPPIIEVEELYTGRLIFELP
ncbi:head GIN domain-containing protein [Luteirhabdus pelagi]|uniref:head GIN domain-containing protein n=1 Tax=Luteirhabdus pelagi TaxID=2792783 RepID=UPI00193A23E8|nr:head GIN domain-containing protein [Luteirhabdus pelagi]